MEVDVSPFTNLWHTLLELLGQDCHKVRFMEYRLLYCLIGRKGGARCIYSCWWLCNNRPERTQRTEGNEGWTIYFWAWTFLLFLNGLTLTSLYFAGRHRPLWTSWDCGKMYLSNKKFACINTTIEEYVCFSLIFRVRLVRLGKKENMDFPVDWYIFYFFVCLFTVYPFNKYLFPLTPSNFSQGRAGIAGRKGDKGDSGGPPVSFFFFYVTWCFIV